jgi:hypothetical protein
VTHIYYVSPAHKWAEPTEAYEKFVSKKDYDSLAVEMKIQDDANEILTRDNAEAQARIAQLETALREICTECLVIDNRLSSDKWAEKIDALLTAAETFAGGQGDKK